MPPIKELRDEWTEEGFRASPTSDPPGFIRLAVRDEQTDAWAEIEIGTAEVDDLIRLLQDAHATARQRLDAAMRPKAQT